MAKNSDKCLQCCCIIAIALNHARLESMSLSTNNLLKGRYRIESVLGQGGMGAVYQATDELLAIPVAVKENLFLSEEYTEQFKQETRILASLRHVNLPRVLDFCSIEGQGQYLVMDYIAGEDLRDLLKRSGPLSEKDVVLIGYHICEALHYMHSQHPLVVHRDVKPGNIKLTELNEIYLVDFGLAKQTSSRSQMTMTGARAMTPGFSPPEQYGTARTDERSDIYSLGATLYNALTGVVPEDALDRVTDRNDLTPILDHRRDTERRLVKVIEKSMALHPEDRYQTAKEFQDALLYAARMQSVTGDVNKLHRFDLNQFDQKESSNRPKPSAVKRSRSSMFFPPKKKTWVGWLFLSLIIIASLGMLFMQPDWVLGLWQGLNPRSTLVTEITRMEATLTSSKSDTIQDTATLEPQMPTLTETEISINTQTLTVTITKIATQTITETPTAETIMEPVVLTTEVAVTRGIQDDFPIVFSSNRRGTNQLWLMDEEGDEKIQLTNIVGGACQPKWAPDGTKIVFVSPCQNAQDEYPNSILYLYTFADKSVVPLLEVDDTLQKIGNYDPEWSPDGGRVSYTSLRQGTSVVNVYEVEKKRITSLTDGDFNAFHPSWRPDGEAIVFVLQDGYTSLWEAPLDGSGIIKISKSGNVNNYHPVWNSEGTFILFSQHNGAQVPWLVKLFKGNFGSALEDQIIIQDVTGSFPVLAPVFASDDEVILFESWPDGRNHDIYKVNVDGTVLIRLTTHSGYDFDPDFYHNRLLPEGEE